MNSNCLAVLLCLACVGFVSSMDQELEPYCHRNETTTTFEEVLKTRTVEKKPKWRWQKSTLVKEIYKEMVPRETVNVIRECCEGFKMNHIGLCEPVCANGCSLHAACVQPNKCECKSGYTTAMPTVDGTTRCVAVCQDPCPENSHCGEPNKCNCNIGYTLTPSMTCEPSCDSGICTEHSTTSTDEAILMDETTETIIFGSSEEDDDSGSDTDSTEDDEDNADFNSSVEAVSDGASNEKDCHYQACPENAHCLANGKCVCDDGFWMQTMKIFSEESNSKESTSEATTLSDDESTTTTTNEDITTELTPQMRAICVKLTEFLADSEEKKMEKAASNGNWMSALYIALGLTCMACAAVFLGVKLLRHRHGQMDVEAKNDLRCEYDSRGVVKGEPMVY